jgi:hypothetical protein
MYSVFLLLEYSEYSGTPIVNMLRGTPYTPRTPMYSEYIVLHSGVLRVLEYGVRSSLHKYLL